MISSPEIVKIGSKRISLNEYGFPSVQISAEGGEKGSPSDLLGIVGKKQFRFYDFAARGSRNTLEDKFPTFVGIYMAEMNPSRCFVLGLRSIVAH